MKDQNYTPRADVYQRVTERIIADLEQGVRPWHRPWRTSVKETASVPRRWDGTPYRGINVLLLWVEASERGYRRNRWMTFRQAKALGAHVRKGERGCMVVFADRVTRTIETDTGEESERTSLLMKSYTVFNLEQIDGLPEPNAAETLVPTDGDETQRLEPADRFFAASGAVFRHGGDSAYYDRANDFIQLPEVGAFRDVEAYAAVKAHELVHWTGHRDRLGREFGWPFGDKAYAFEELVAEMGAAFLCADLGISSEPRPDHASYLGHWLAVMKDNPRSIFTAASAAQRAADFLHGLQNQEHAPGPDLAAG